MNLRLPVGATIVGYADDLALLVTASDLWDLVCHITEGIETRWLDSKNLKLVHKIEVTLLVMRRSLRVIDISVGNLVITKFWENS